MLLRALFKAVTNKSAHRGLQRNRSPVRKRRRRKRSVRFITKEEREKSSNAHRDGLTTTESCVPGSPDSASDVSDEFDDNACADDEREDADMSSPEEHLAEYPTEMDTETAGPGSHGASGSLKRERTFSKEESEERLEDRKVRTLELEDELPASKKNQDIKKSDFVLDPDGDVAYYWMGTVTSVVIYNYWVIILRIAFSEMREEAVYQTIFTYMDVLSDSIFVLDVVVQLRTAYLEHGILVSDPGKLSSNYRRKKECRRDVLSVFPLGCIVQFFNSIIPLDGFQAYVSEASLSAHACRLPRLLKFHTMSKFFQTTDSRTNNPNTVRAFKLSLYLGVIIHWIGCFYYMISEHEGFGSNEWVYPLSKRHQSFTCKYIRSFYWSLVTLTTIGGTANPETNMEYMFTGVTFLIGVFVFAAVVGNVGDVISNMNAARAEFQSRMDAIKVYMNHRKVPEHLQKRVKKWSDYSWHRTQMIDESNLLEMLPERLRAEIAIHVHLETLKKVNIFEGCEHGLLCELVLKLKSLIYSPGDYICRTGEIGREMYIINHGKVEVVITDEATGGKMVVATMSEGNYFGEISLLKLDAGCNKRTADVRSVGYSELLVLSRKDLMSALVEYPDAKKVLEAQGRARMERSKEVRKTQSEEKAEEALQAAEEASKMAPATIIRQHKGSPYTIMRHDDAKKLFDTKAKELSEIVKLLHSIKNEESHATMQKISRLAERVDDLKSQLRRRDVELRTAMCRILQLEKILESERHVTQNKRIAKECSLITDRIVRNSYQGNENNSSRNDKLPSKDGRYLHIDSRECSRSRDRQRRQETASCQVNVPGICVNGIIEQEPTNVAIENTYLSDSSRPSTPDTPSSPGYDTNFVFMDGQVVQHQEAILSHFLTGRTKRRASDSTNYTSDFTSEFDDSDFDFR
ncbi:cyclic nucleotide-gated channel rod photoreceptor subunit alpha-like isoform X2 [Ptychodera flava]|uniref:cyclic nucleotide-gated channel rod photoreceptor subunit alpha-like isoform X2 n=1 Tax=Ptychodera flava TaxID=63121 RepID=UPI00396AA499